MNSKQVLTRLPENPNVCTWVDADTLVSDHSGSDDLTRHQRSEVNDLIGEWADDNLGSRVESEIESQLESNSSIPSHDDMDEKIDELRREIESDYVSDTDLHDKLDDLREELKANAAGAPLNPQATFEAVRDCFARLPMAQRLELVVALLMARPADERLPVDHVGREIGDVRA